jgi:hypothetical protein
MGQRKYMVQYEDFANQEVVVKVSELQRVPGW